jgi:hypothetical protein
MTRLTAIIIRTRGDDIRCDAGGPNRDGKWTGWVTLYNGDDYDHELLSTQPVYDSKDAAVAAVQEVVRVVRAMTEEELM